MTNFLKTGDLIVTKKTVIYDEIGQDMRNVNQGELALFILKSKDTKHGKSFTLEDCLIMINQEFAYIDKNDFSKI
jgi:hypothetical protein